MSAADPKISGRKRAHRISCCLHVVLLITVLQTSGAQDTAKKLSNSPSKETWRPGIYRGLVVGKSTQADMLRILGKPSWSGYEPDVEIKKGHMSYSYSNQGEFSGEAVVYVTWGTIRGITLEPKESIPRSVAIKRFGTDFIIRRYSADDCLNKGGSSPIYQDPKGAIKILEYPARGLVLNVDQYGYDIGSVSYTDGPPGSPDSRCKKGKATRPRN
jgi:hypothetical protein